MQWSPRAKKAKKAFIITTHAPAEIVSGYRNIAADDLVIAVDGGLEQVDRLGLIPDLLIGDFDSVRPELLDKYHKVKRITHPPEKNETDTELAVMWCLNLHSLLQVIICNDLQGRFDHALGLVQNLMYAMASDTSIRIESSAQMVSILCGKVILKNRKGQLLSLIPLGNDLIFESSNGLKYPLAGLTIRAGESRGISNVITDEEASINISSGIALAIFTISD